MIMKKYPNGKGRHRGLPLRNFLNQLLDSGDPTPWITPRHQLSKYFYFLIKILT
jgi:hypothetical protein